MDLIIITTLALLLFTFVAMMRKPQKAFIDRFMEKGHNVQPLFKQKSAQIKYADLHEAMQRQKADVTRLEALKKTYDEGVISVDAYSQMLDEIYQAHIKH